MLQLRKDRPNSKARLAQCERGELSRNLQPYETTSPSSCRGRSRARRLPVDSAVVEALIGQPPPVGCCRRLHTSGRFTRESSSFVAFPLKARLLRGSPTPGWPASQTASYLRVALMLFRVAPRLS